MDGFKEGFSGLLHERRVVFGIGVGVAMLALLAALLTGLKATPKFEMLYSGLEARATGEVIAALEEQGAGYYIKGNTLFVASGTRDLLRVRLAAQGLPKPNAQGYELLDGLSGFSTSYQMFDAAYWRAKEGELARTIAANPMIKQARVHLSRPAGRGVSRQSRPKASVALSSAGHGLSAAHVQALKYLIASAVEGLALSDVAVIDDRLGILHAPAPNAAAAHAETRAQQLKAKAERLLEAQFGLGNAVVEVSIETVHTREKLVERIYDPDGRVEVSRQTQETVQSDQDTGSQRVGAASNLPDFAANSGNGVTRENNENTETVNYQTSEINREVLISPDMIKHLSVAVLLNTRALEAPAGGTALVQDVEDLVASAIGLRPDRGDLITVKAMDFSDPRAGAYAPNQAPVSGAAPASQASYKLLATGLVLAVMLYFIFRPLLKASRPRMAPQPPRLAVEPSTSAPMPARVEETSEPGLLDRALSGGAARSDPPPSGQDALSQLSQGMGARKEDILEILHTWLQGEKRVI